MSTPHMLIIGAGVAGLSAGCYAQMNGFDSHIFESHTIPGGLCTAWRREGYLFDGALRYLVGTGEHTHVYPMWRELGVLPGRGVHYYDEFNCYEGRDGRSLHFFTDPDRLEDHLLTLSPQDTLHICEFTHALRDLGDFDLPLDLIPDDAIEGLNFGRIMLEHARPLIHWMDISVCDFASRFKDALLREAFPDFFQCTPPDFPMLMLLMTLAQMGARASGYLLGGSLRLAESIAARYQGLGGTLTYGARVTNIIVDNDKAVGVRLADGTVHHADVVISAADGHATIFDLLAGRYVNDDIRKRYAVRPKAESIVQVALGVHRDFSDCPPMLSIPLTQPIDTGGREHYRLTLKHYCFDSAMADPGTSSLTVWAEADYDYWQSLYTDPDRYAARKASIGQQVIAALDKRFPGLATQVDVVDVATPVTYERYTSTWHGSIHGWALGKDKMRSMMHMGMSKILPGLGDFYMIGQWVEPAGNMQLSAASGRDVIEMLCRKCKQTFVTSEAEAAETSVHDA